MEVVERLFAKPFEVTQFWASDKYLVMQQQAGSSVASLCKYCPSHASKFQPTERADWFFQVRDGEGGPFACDFLPRILPTRHNIAILNNACTRASAFLGAELEKGAITEDVNDDQSLFADALPFVDAGEMDIAKNAVYQRDLWNVLADDWGLQLPPPGRLCIDSVTIRHKPGLPCAAAMVRAVQPILEVVYGDLDVVRQSTCRQGERYLDEVEYRREDGQILMQRYDITEVCGRVDLDWNFFDFCV